jgi:hypothetical protein
MKPSSELDLFLTGLARDLSQGIRSGYITSDYLQTTVHNKHNKVHNVVCGIIEQAGHRLGYVVERERHFRFEGGTSYFKPDLLLWKNDRLSLLVEYESTNSSDSRVVERDLGLHYSRALKIDAGVADARLPEYWLIVYTLPDGPVEQKHWRSWDFLKARPEYATMRRNPHRFYKRALKDPSPLDHSRRDSRIVKTDRLQAITELANYDPASRSDRKLFLLNLTIDGLEIDFPEAYQRKVSF